MILEVRKLTKKFGGLVAVDGLDFHLNESEILGIIGPNGAGKTTVLNMISGFFQPSAGEILYSNQNITGLKDHEICSLGIARNFQASVLFMDIPVMENVFFAYHLQYKAPIWKRLLRLPSAIMEEEGMRQKGEAVLERMGLGPFKNEITKNLPHGYQRILGVCVAMATNPKILLLDEPMTGMNLNEIQTMSNLIRKIRDSGITIIMIEHNMNAVMSLCDRIVVLNYGRKIAEGSSTEIQTDPKVIEAYLGKQRKRL